jgi:hypothetical protein
MKSGIVTPDMAVRSDDTVTRDYNRDTIPFVGKAHGASASRVAHGLCYITVRAYLTVRNLLQLFPDSALEGGPLVRI